MYFKRTNSDCRSVGYSIPSSWLTEIKFIKNIDDLYKTKLETEHWFVLSGIEIMICLDCFLQTEHIEIITE
jgi:hypothetical protein